MSEKIKNILLEVCANLFFIGALLFLFVNPWADKNYPMQKHWNVFFVLSADTSGHDSGTGLSIFLGFVLPSVILFLVFTAFRIFIWKKKGLTLPAGKYLCAAAMLFALSLAVTAFSKQGWRYVQISRAVKAAPADSEFYRAHFVDTSEVSLTAPQKKRNLVYIFMESMENSYADYDNGGVMPVNLIPELTALCNEGVNFGASQGLGGGENLEGTSWTSAGLLSKTMGVPYFMPFSKNADGSQGCLDNTRSLYDFLSDQGYRNVFAMGSEKQFENRDLILERHGVEVHDIGYYKASGMIPADYQVFWGFEDQKLYEVSKKELEALGERFLADGAPFSFSLLTVDTHFPSGFKCALCMTEHSSQIENVISCADRQVAAFIRWIQSTTWGRDTVIVITGDHNYLDAPLNNFMREHGAAHSWAELQARRHFFNLFINAAKEPPAALGRSRAFSSFDMMPSVLEALGFTFDTDGIALGRSLFSEEPTLIERFGVQSVEAETMRRTVQYERLK